MLHTFFFDFNEKKSPKNTKTQKSGRYPPSVLASLSLFLLFLHVETNTLLCLRCRLIQTADCERPPHPLIAAPYIQYQTLHSLLYSGQNIEMSGRSDDCHPVTLSSLSWVSVQETKENSLFVKVCLCSVSGCLWFWCFPAGTLEEEETGNEVSWASLALFLLRMNMNSAQLRFLTVPSDSVPLQTGFQKKGTEEEDFTLIHRITRRDEVVQTLVIKLPFVKCSCGMSSMRQVAEIWIQP